jgi:riboflavin kinase / FMN adenylyltransferase
MSYDLAPAGERSIAIGSFDGVHLGHRAVIERAIETSRELGVRSTVLAMYPHPMAVLRTREAPSELSTLPRRIELAAEIGPDEVIVLPFTEQLSQLGAAEFVSDILVRRLGVRAVTVGQNFHYGHRAAGTVQTLAAAGAELGFSVTAMPLLEINGAPVSSTRIRKLVLEGDVTGAALLLGRNPWLDGEVVHGDKRGRELGYPTANLEPSPVAVVPAVGIYAGWAHLVGSSHVAAISVGRNPTFTGEGAPVRVEAHLLDFDADIYGQPLRLEFAHHLRDELRFDSAEALIAQLHDDVRLTRELCAQ